MAGLPSAFHPRMTTRAAQVRAILAAAVAAAGAADAFTIETHFTSGCHERVTAQALRTARLALALPRDGAPTSEERALIDDLQFRPEPDMTDLSGATLLVGVRDNDLKGNSQDDLSVLAFIHGNPDNQPEHCLRGPDQKEPGGTAAAVAACRAFVRGRIADALDGLGADGRPDLSLRTSVSLHLSLRGQIDASLPTYYLRMGQAMHALQDSFTHTYRTPDGTQITVVLNWLSEVNGTLVESRDGPGHATGLDVCNDSDAFLEARRVLAVSSSSALLQATMDPRKTRDQKMVAADQVLDAVLGFSPACTFANDWCQAHERQYRDSKNFLGCSTSRPGTLAVWGALLLCFFPRRRRKRQAAAPAVVVAALFLLAAGSARAGTDAGPAAPDAGTSAPTATSTTVTTPAKPATRSRSATAATTTTTVTTTTSGPPDGNEHLPPAPTIVAVEEPGPRDPTRTAWGAYFGSSGSVDKAAVAVQLGARFKSSKHWTFGLDGEWNPWITLNGYRFGSGVFNFYGTAILRFPLTYENFNLRATANLGVSVLLMNPLRRARGEHRPLCRHQPRGPRVEAVADFHPHRPLGIALPVPQLHAVPLSYPQYRFSIGFEIQSG